MEKILVDKTTEFYGWIASFLTALLFLNPIKSFIKLIKGKIEFQNSPAFLVTVCYISNICWYVYGEKISSKPLKCCNLFGMIVNFILIFIYLFFEIRVYTIDAILNCLIVIIGTYELYKSFVQYVQDFLNTSQFSLNNGHYISTLEKIARINNFNDPIRIESPLLSEYTKQYNIEVNPVLDKYVYYLNHQTGDSEEEEE